MIIKRTGKRTKKEHHKLAKLIYKNYFYYKFHLNTTFDAASSTNVYKEISIDLARDILITIDKLISEVPAKKYIDATIMKHEGGNSDSE